MGGMIVHFIGSNYLAVLIQPSYEETIDTIEELLESDKQVKKIFMYHLPCTIILNKAPSSSCILFRFFIFMEETTWQSLFSETLHLKYTGTLMKDLNFHTLKRNIHR